jgi:dTMP kinase
MLNNRNHQEDVVRIVNAYATAGLNPDVTILLDLDPVEALTRARHAEGGHDRIEAKSADYHRAVRESYLALAERETRFRIVDAAGTPDAVHARVRKAVQSVVDLVR